MRSHILGRGERICDLSARYGVPVCMIVRANIGKRFMPGATVAVPDEDFCRGEAYKRREHVVDGADTLYAIANKYGVTMDMLMRENGFAHPEEMRADSKIAIPDLPQNFYIYTIAMGETLADISAKAGVPESDICSINRIREGIYPGMQILLPGIAEHN